MSIRTPDQRLRVFISSTLGELAAERGAARDAIESLHLTPVMFEQGARPHPPRPLYRAYLQQSDVFVGLYWQRYGWVAPDMEISGLEDEWLLSDGRPRLVYLKRPAPDLEPGMKGLLERIGAVTSYKSFATETVKLFVIRFAFAFRKGHAGPFAQAVCHVSSRGGIVLKPHDSRLMRTGRPQT